MAKLKQWLLRIAAVILDRAANQTGRCTEADRLRNAFRRIIETLFQIGRDREIGRFDDRAAMGNRLRSRDHAVAAAEDAGRGPARRRQGPKTEPGENPCRARIPHIPDDETAGGLMQRSEAVGLIILARCHAFLLPRPASISWFG